MFSCNPISQSFLACVVMTLAFSAPAAAAEPTRPVSPEEIAAWIRDLDANRFLTREQATAKLVQAGEAAIEPLVAILPTSSLEVSQRGVHILQEIALGPNEISEEAAETALERLANIHGSRSVADCAVDAINALAVMREDRSTESLKALGAKFNQEVVALGGFGVVRQLTLTIDDDFHGAEADLRLLAYLPNVDSLWLVGSKVNDNTLARAARMRNLGELCLKRAKTTDEALAQLKRLPHLARVRLYYTPFTDGAVQHLTSLKALEHVELFGTRVSNEGVVKMQQALVGTRIDVRRGGFLGVGPQPHPDGCIIGTIVEGSAAEKAGLEIGDIVTHFDNKKVGDFESLTRLIGENLPGDKVPLNIIRDGEKAVVTVELGEWNLSHRPR